MGVELSCVLEVAETWVAGVQSFTRQFSKEGGVKAAYLNKKNMNDYVSSKVEAIVHVCCVIHVLAVCALVVVAKAHRQLYVMAQFAFLTPSSLKH